MQDISQTNKTNIFAIQPKIALQQSLEKFKKKPFLSLHKFAKTAKFYFAPAREKRPVKFMGGKVMLNTPHKADCDPEIPTTFSPREHQVYVPLAVPVLPPSPDHVDHALRELNQVPRHPGDVRPVDAKVLDADVEGWAHLVLDGGELAKEEN